MLRKLRLYFNVRVSALASYIGISYHTLSSLSVSRRSYNLEELNKLLALYKALELKKDLPELSYAMDFLELEKELAMESLQELLKKLRRSLSSRKVSLQNLQTKRGQWLRGIHACSLLLKEGSLSAKDAKWISLRKRHLEVQLAENPYFREVQILAEVHALEKQIDWLFRQAQ